MFWPLDPRPDEVDLEDIAHALSLVCRFGGHCKRFYSVAEHSVRVHDLVAPEFRFAALLHDAAEAYVGDMVTPLKRSMPLFSAAEERVARAIGARFGVGLVPLPTEVKRADLEMLAVEARDLMTEPPRPWVLPFAAPVGMHIAAPLTPAEAREVFLERFETASRWRR